MEIVYIFLFSIVLLSLIIYLCIRHDRKQERLKKEADIKRIIQEDEDEDEDFGEIWYEEG